jgi:hypothetical protein
VLWDREKGKRQREKGAEWPVCMGGDLWFGN